MKLITEEFELLFKDYPLYSQEHEKDPIVIAKLFDPCSAATWYLTEYDPAEKIAFSYVTGLVQKILLVVTFNPGFGPLSQIPSNRIIKTKFSAFIFEVENFLVFKNFVANPPFW